MTRQRKCAHREFSSNTELKGIYSWIVHRRFHVMLVLLLSVIEAYEVLCYVRNL